MRNTGGKRRRVIEMVWHRYYFDTGIVQGTLFQARTDKEAWNKARKEFMDYKPERNTIIGTLFKYVLIVNNDGGTQKMVIPIRYGNIREKYKQEKESA